MTGAARLGDAYSCGDIQAGGSGNVFVNGMPFARNNDPTAGHSCWPPSVSVATSTTVFVNNILACRISDPNAGHACGPSFHVGNFVQGSPDVFVES